MGKTVYRLKKKTPLSWTLKQKNVRIAKEGEGLKFINYYPGGSSIYTDDNKDREPATIEFEKNDLTGFTEIQVDDANILLNNYLKAHPWYGKMYEVFSPEIAAQRKNEDFDKKEKALALLKESDDLKIQAKALAILGNKAYGWSPVRCMSELRDTAWSNPDVILEKFNDPQYHSLYIASLAMIKGIVKSNPGQTAVVWNNEDAGVIVHVATGEEPIKKLSALLAETTERSRVLLQEISQKVDEKTKAVSIQKDDEKDREIAELKRQLAEATKKYSGETVEKKEVSDKPYEEMELEELQAAYEAKFEKNLSFKYANDRDWILGKLNA